MHEDGRLPQDPLTDHDRLEVELERIRDVVEKQQGVGRPAAAKVDPKDLIKFSPTVSEPLDPARRAELEKRATELEPWLQGPFLLGGDLVVGGAWRTDLRWHNFGPEVGESLKGKRVLDVGSNAGWDPFMFNLRGADYVMACEPFAFYHQFTFLQEIYGTSIDIKQIGWEDLDPEEHGTFDMVHCHGVLYHEANPMLLLQMLRPMLRPDGVMFFGSMMLGDPEQTEFMRFVPGAYFGDPTWWVVPGRMAMRWMLEAAGFKVVKEFGLHDGPRGEFWTINGYFKCEAGEPSTLLTPPNARRRPW